MGLACALQVLCKAGGSPTTIDDIGWTPASMAVTMALHAVSGDGKAKQLPKKRAMSTVAAFELEVNALSQEERGASQEIAKAKHFSSLLGHLSIAQSDAIAGVTRAAEGTAAGFEQAHTQECKMIQLLALAAGVSAGAFVPATESGLCLAAAPALRLRARRKDTYL